MKNGLMRPPVARRRGIALVAGALVLGLVGLLPGQQQIDTHVGPVYPSNPSNNHYHRSQSNYDPYQFNWYSGRWDYVPIPYQPSSEPPPPSPYQLNPYTGHWEYLPIQPAPPIVAQPPAATSDISKLPQNDLKPDDSELWTAPATQPSGAAPKREEFQGKLLGIQAVDLAGEASPHLLLRFHTSAGAKITVDVGNRLLVPESGDQTLIRVSGEMGAIDGNPVLFADHVDFGAQKIEIKRHPSTER